MNKEYKEFLKAMEEWKEAVIYYIDKRIDENQEKLKEIHLTYNDLVMAFIKFSREKGNFSMSEKLKKHLLTKNL